MTEQEWLACEDPAALLAATQGTLSERKHRLWACAVARCDWDGLPVIDQYFGDYPGIQRAVAAAERYCDGAAGSDDLARASLDAAHALQVELSMPQSARTISVMLFKEWGVLAGSPDVVADSARAAAAAAERLKTLLALAPKMPKPLRDSIEEERKHLLLLPHLFREIAGDPFRPVTFSPSWRTDTAVALAKQMYESRVFDAMPILADALQDAGCEEAAILDHCRGPGPHVPGCWVMDLVLGKE